MHAPVDISDRIRDALASGRPVVALESTVIAHGLPAPLNLETARAMEDAVRHEGAEPATIAPAEIARWIATALDDARRHTVSGKAVTPFLLPAVRTERRPHACRQYRPADRERPPRRTHRPRPGRGRRARADALNRLIPRPAAADRPCGRRRRSVRDQGRFRRIPSRRPWSGTARTGRGRCAGPCS